MATLASTASQIYYCDHTAPDGTSAYVCIGKYGEGYEQCIKCGDVKCTEPMEEPELFSINVPA